MMFSRGLLAAFATWLCTSALAAAQTPTPARVDSNVAFDSYAQSNGQDLAGTPCSARGATGCGGCYAQSLTSLLTPGDILGQLITVDPEWQAVGTMIPGLDASLAPVAVPVLMTGTVGLSKSPGDDFPGSHYSPDYNAEVIPDNNGLLATGNTNNRVEFEWEGNKLPMFAWSGEGDRMMALGRWIFDCGHPDPGPYGKCSNDALKSCILDVDCTSPGTCTNPPATFAVQSELHPPQAVVVLRNKSIAAGHTVPATRADVYISADGGGAGDRCTVTHLADATDVLFNKHCSINHCSKTTGRSCHVDADCAGSETCITLDPANRLANINAPNFNHCSTTPHACSIDTDCPSGETCVLMENFAFDMPLPPAPSGAATLKIRTKYHKPKGGQMPKPIFVAPVGPTPNLHVIIPMATPLPNKKMPDVFAGSITAGWKEDTTLLKHVQVRFDSITINNPLKDSTPAVPRLCTDPLHNKLSSTPCTTNADCPTSVCAGSLAPCNVNSDCKKNDFCFSDASQCIGGIIPGWDLWGEVNGDWVKFQNMAAIGAQAPFAGPPYLQPSPTPSAIKQKFKFDEYVPVDGAIHIKVSGHSLNCLSVIFGDDLITNLHKYDLGPGAACLNAGTRGAGEVDLTYTGPNFGTVARNKPVTFTANSTGSAAGTCSTTTNQLCVTNADCPGGETCNPTDGAFTLQYTIVVK